MKQLKQLVRDKINELGIPEAAKYFGKSENSIKVWLKGNVPLEAAQKVLDDPLTQVDMVSTVHSPNQKTAPAQLDNELDSVWQRLAELNARLSQIEAFLREHFPMGFDAAPEPPQQVSMIEPIPSTNVPPAIVPSLTSPGEATLKDNKPSRPPNASLDAPVPVREGPWVPDPRSWSRPHKRN